MCALALAVAGCTVARSENPAWGCESDADCDGGTCHGGFCLSGPSQDAGAGCDGGACSAGCGNSCAVGETCCGTSSGGQECANLGSSPDHCGDCGTRCDAGQACCGSDGCIDVQADASNCGACGNVCQSGQLCCGGLCINPRSSNDHCGTCDVSCDGTDTSTCCPAASDGTVGCHASSACATCAGCDRARPALLRRELCRQDDGRSQLRRLRHGLRGRPALLWRLVRVPPRRVHQLRRSLRRLPALLRRRLPRRGHRALRRLRRRVRVWAGVLLQRMRQPDERQRELRVLWPSLCRAGVLERRLLPHGHHLLRRPGVCPAHDRFELRRVRPYVRRSRLQLSFPQQRLPMPHRGAPRLLSSPRPRLAAERSSTGATPRRFSYTAEPGRSWGSSLT